MKRALLLAPVFFVAACATAPPKQETWGVSILQNGTVQRPGSDGAIVLQRTPFTIRVASGNFGPVQINAAATDVNFRKVHAGYDMVKDCMGADRMPFCLGSQFAEGDRNEAQRLNVDPEGAHYVYYENDTDMRWSKMTYDGSRYILDRAVANLGSTPIEKTRYVHLYVTVLQRGDDGGILREDEIRRITIRFR